MQAMLAWSCLANDLADRTDLSDLQGVAADMSTTLTILAHRVRREWPLAGTGQWRTAGSDVIAGNVVKHRVDGVRSTNGF
jgi:hypothetical protein